MTREEYEEIKKSNAFREDERPCRETVTKERLYERLNNAIRQSEIMIMKEEARLDTLRTTKRNLDEYFEDLEKSEDK